MARLIVKSGDGTHTIDLDPGKPVRVGRDADNEIALPDERQASRHHCRIAAVQTGGVIAWEVSDLGATNKTRVNGKATDKRVLASGDVVQVGRVEIAFEDPEEEARLKAAGAKGVCYLEWVKGDHRGEKVMLEATRTTLGRRASNTIPLDDRMSSGHHAEITRDLNGYTIRDLGSTNGTLVNGEPTTEATLSHGTRVRIGNSHFVFKDPSMKDVEIELSQLEDDEGWGMMGDIDLTRARGSYVGLLLGLLLLLGAGAAGYYFFDLAEKGGTVSEVVGESNLVRNGDMEDAESIPLLWDAPGDDAPVSIGTTKRGKGLALALRHTGGDERPAPVVVSYTDEFPALASEPLQVRANLQVAGGDAALVAVWQNKADAASGATGLTHTIRLGSGRVNVVAPKPSWADQVSIGVWLGRGASAVLDDLLLTRVSGGGAAVVELECPGDPKAWLHTAGSLDLVNSLTVLVVGAAPVVRLPDGSVLTEFVPGGAPEGGGASPLSVEGQLRSGEKTVPVTVRWSRNEAGDGLTARIECAEAAAVGLDASLVRAHVGDGLNVVTAKGAGSIATTAGEQLEAVDRVLAGDPKSSGGRPRTLVQFAPQGEMAAHALELHDAADPSLLVLRQWIQGTSGAFDLVTDFEMQTKEANQALIEAESAVSTQPGVGIDLLKRVKVLYPFNERVRARAAILAEEAERMAREQIDDYEAALQAFRIFRSVKTLADLDEKGRALRERFPPRESGEGALEGRVAAIDAQAAEARAAWYAENAGDELTRLERLADLLADVEGYAPMAAIFYRTIVDRFGHLEGDDAFGRRVLRARTQYEQLTKDASVKEAIPEVK